MRRTKRQISRSNQQQQQQSNNSDEDLADLLLAAGSRASSSSSSDHQDSNNRKSLAAETNNSTMSDMVVMGGANSATASLNLDHLTNQKLEVVTPFNNRGGALSKKRRFRNGRHMSFTEYCCSYFSMLCYYYPRSCGCLIVSLLLTIMLLLASFILNPVSVYGVILHDHSNIRSKYDLSMGEIHHWCLGGDDKSCTCEDPLIPVSRVEYKSWVEALKANRKMLKQRFQEANNPTTGTIITTAQQKDQVDVAFLGESISKFISLAWRGGGLCPYASIFFC